MVQHALSFEEQEVSPCLLGIPSSQDDESLGENPVQLENLFNLCTANSPPARVYFSKIGSIIWSKNIVER